MIYVAGQIAIHCSGEPTWSTTLINHPYDPPRGRLSLQRGVGQGLAWPGLAYSGSPASSATATGAA